LPGVEVVRLAGDRALERVDDTLDAGVVELLEPAMILGLAVRDGDDQPASGLENAAEVCQRREVPLDVVLGVAGVVHVQLGVVEPDVLQGADAGDDVEDAVSDHELAKVVVEVGDGLSHLDVGWRESDEQQPLLGQARVAQDRDVVEGRASVQQAGWAVRQPREHPGVLHDALV
jgi:hypothetical protein